MYAMKLDIAKAYDTLRHTAIDKEFVRRGLSPEERATYWREHIARHSEVPTRGTVKRGTVISGFFRIFPEFLKLLWFCQKFVIFSFLDDFFVTFRIFPATFRIFPDFSGFSRIFPDFSGLFRISPDFSGLFRI